MIRAMKRKIRKDLSVWIATAAYVLFLLVCILLYAMDYITNVIQVESFSQFLYTMQVGMGGAGNTIAQILKGFFLQYFFWIFSATVLYSLFLRLALKGRKYKKENGNPCYPSSRVITLNGTAALTAVAAAATLVVQLGQGYDALKIDQYLTEQSITSTLYEDHYVMTDSSLVHAPQKKKNLIYIYMESMEASFTDKAHGGGFEDNLIPNLERIARENTDFRAKDDPYLNGGQVTNKTSWTVAGMVAQTSGTVLGVSNSKYNHSFDENMLFMPNIKSLGDLLEEQGYTNVLMCGSEASYAGRANYFRQHGNYDIYDLDRMHANGKLPKNYHEWWGYEDSKLVDFAKDKILELAGSRKPFNFTMLTADTHFKDGYLCPDCPDSQDEQYENVILCSDKRIGEFVDWIRQQDFYKDTVVVLAGDHLSMDGLISQSVGLDYGRKTYFSLLNGKEYTLNKTRDYTTLDLFPTTLEAMGFEIDGHRLGLGTSLYADIPTLCESMGFDELNQQISYHNKRYEEEIMKDDGLEKDTKQPYKIPHKLEQG